MEGIGEEDGDGYDISLYNYEILKKKKKSPSARPGAHTQSQHSRGRGKRTLSSRLARSTQQVRGQPELHSETLVGFFCFVFQKSHPVSHVLIKLRVAGSKAGLLGELCESRLFSHPPS